MTSAGSSAKVDAIRKALLDLHRSLMHAQRVRYEREHGRIGSSNEFLGLVLEHPAFAWLRALSALIAQLDEWIETGEGDADLTTLLDMLRGMLAVDGTNVAFGKPYRELVEAEPDVLVEHVKLWRLLSPRP